MTAYVTRATAALDAFDAALADVSTAADAAAADSAVSAPARTRLFEACERLGHASAAMRLSFAHIERTALDVVDMQARLEGESAALAAALRLLGDTVEKAPHLRASLTAVCGRLEEAAAGVASATFPNAVEGLAAVNRALWDFHGPVWKAYERKLADVVSRQRLTSIQIGKIDSTARDIRNRFDAVNQLIDDLASRPAADRAHVARTVADAQRNLSEALASARARAGEVYKPFHGVLNQAQGVAARVIRHLERCRVPIFPSPDALGDAVTLVDATMYTGLPGVCRFALLNILSALRAVRIGPAGEHLLSPTYLTRVFAVFPDRVYIEATPALLDVTRSLTRSGTFTRAPAALHRFRDGSVKQRDNRKGNIQLSYEDAGAIVRVDADIDLYRGPISHLFGEVLINHLTGTTTDQFAVRRVLDGRSVVPLGGFSVWSAIG